MSVTPDIIHSIYNKYLGREADPEGLQYYGSFNSIAEVENAILDSYEFKRNDLIIRRPNWLSAWKACIIEEAKILFIPIGKNAHTSILSAFSEFKGIDWRKMQVSDELVNEHGRDRDKLHYALSENNTGLLLKDHSPSFINDVLARKDYLRIAVFRDPVQRLISAHTHFFMKEVKSPLALRHSQEVFNAHYDEATEKYSIGEHELGITQFVKFIVSSNRYDLDPHWAPQYDYISAIKMDYIIPIERLDLLERIIAARSGKNIKIGSHNVMRGAGLDSERHIKQEVRDTIEDFYWIDRKLYEMAKVEAEQISEAF